MPKVEWRRDRITVRPAEGWRRDRVYRVELLPDRVLIYTGNGDATADAINRDTGPLQPAAVLVRRSSLEDVFLTLTGRTLED